MATSSTGVHWEQIAVRTPTGRRHTFTTNRKPRLPHVSHNHRLRLYQRDAPRWNKGHGPRSRLDRHRRTRGHHRGRTRGRHPRPRGSPRHRRPGRLPHARPHQHARSFLRLGQAGFRWRRGFADEEARQPPGARHRAAHPEKQSSNPARQRRHNGPRSRRPLDVRPGDPRRHQRRTIHRPAHRRPGYGHHRPRRPRSRPLRPHRHDPAGRRGPGARPRRTRRGCYQALHHRRRLRCNRSRRTRRAAHVARRRPLRMQGGASARPARHGARREHRGSPGRP